MMNNPILDELHAIRRKLLDDAGGTLDALVDRLQAEEQESNRQPYRGRRTDRCTGAAKSGVAAVVSQTSPPA
jgi:hypothetical protein